MEFGKKLYSVRESYWIFYSGIRTMRYMFMAKKNGELSSTFIERIMLAVTEVNECAICSYAHAKRALECGMGSEEIQDMLSGIINNVPAPEVAGVMFAQHYADTRGNPTQESWGRIVEVYGTSTAMGILGAIRTIMIGNTYGIAFSSFFNRFRGRADPRSSLGYELGLILSAVVVIPVSIIHAVVSGLVGKPIIG
jgi:AhpD family alkylhydroperoxidase